MPFISCNNIRINYERAGKGPELVLIHGLGGDVRDWELFAARLKDDFTLVMFDMRGSGKSDKPEKYYSMEMLGEDAASFIEQACGGPANILGFSMGGIAAMDVAIKRPELVERLILVSTLASWDGPFPPSDRTKTLFHRTDIGPELLTEVYETVFGSEYKKRVSAKEYIDFRLNDECPQPLHAYLNQLRALETCDISGKVSFISAPALIVAGKEDRVVPPQNSLWLKEKIRGSRLEIFEGAGHMIPLEMSERLADTTKEAILA